jgi:uncharacterized damage-inducible protein DinB
MATETASLALVTPETLLDNWQAHRRLTRKVIAAFPEDELFHFTIGGMRTFGQLVMEMIGMTIPVVEGIATGKWAKFEHGQAALSKADLLSLWDVQTALLNQKFATIPAERFFAIDKAFGLWEMPNIVMLQYAVDNEIHHRGQGYVYLRALNIAPPPFYERD